MKFEEQIIYIHISVNKALNSILLINRNFNQAPQHKKVRLTRARLQVKCGKVTKLLIQISFSGTHKSSLIFFFNSFQHSANELLVAQLINIETTKKYIYKIKQNSHFSFAFSLFRSAPMPIQLMNGYQIMLISQLKVQ